MAVTTCRRSYMSNHMNRQRKLRKTPITVFESTPTSLLPHPILTLFNLVYPQPHHSNPSVQTIARDAEMSNRHFKKIGFFDQLDKSFDNILQNAGHPKTGTAWPVDTKLQGEMGVRLDWADMGKGATSRGLVVQPNNNAKCPALRHLDSHTKLDIVHVPVKATFTAEEREAAWIQFVKDFKERRHT
ncbi:hypothetical protein OF83DRAFT_1087201 [Amylostereum chailletii]|nr:hypothetical protein OF83DRAFT_1087201 [Amylostereum chailletii]